MTVYYRDAGNRSVSDEQIALAWIKANPEAAARAIGRSPPPPRPFAVHAKSTDGKTARVLPADPEDDE